MIDITTIELNKIPMPIAELESANSILRTRNAILQKILIIGGVVLAIIIANRIIKHNQEKNGRKHKG